MEKRKTLYLSLKEIVLLSKRQGVNFGKGSPYNRLRYYTKIGLLPNMVRVKSQGHYPKDALEKLVRIEKLKSLGWDNERIKEEFKKESLTIKLNPESKKKWLQYFFATSFACLLLIGVFQTNLGLANKTSDNFTKGAGTVLPGQKSIFVFDKDVKNESKIFVTFVSSYAPATSYFVSSKVEGLGFEVTLSSPSSKVAEFNYFVVN